MQIKIYDSISERDSERSLMADVMAAIKRLNISAEVIMVSNPEFLGLQDMALLPSVAINGTYRIRGRYPYSNELLYMLLDEIIYESGENVNTIFKIAIQ